MAIVNLEYKQWISNIERRFRQQQIKAAVQVNSSKIEFYWSLGRDICEMHVEERWGESVIKQLSEDLRLVIEEAKGLTPINLYYCKRFYLFYSQLFEKVPQLVEIFKPQHKLLEQMNDSERKSFEQPYLNDFVPEVGSRALQKSLFFIVEDGTHKR